MSLQTLVESSDGSSSSDEEQSFSKSLDPTQDSPSMDHPRALPLSAAATTITAAAAGKNREKASRKPKTVSTSQKSSQTLPATTRKDSHKSDRKYKKQKDPLFNNTDSDSDSFATTSQHTALPFPANTVPETVVTDPLAVFDVSHGAEGERVRQLSDSSEDSIVVPDRLEQSMLRGIQSTPPPDDLLQKYNQVSISSHYEYASYSLLILMYICPCMPDYYRE